MHNSFQKTLKTRVSFEGIGLHSGKIARVSLVPANANSGIVFKRTDIKDNNIIKANYKNIYKFLKETVITQELIEKLATGIDFSQAISQDNEVLEEAILTLLRLFTIELKE